MLFKTISIENDGAKGYGHVIKVFKIRGTEKIVGELVRDNFLRGPLY